MQNISNSADSRVTTNGVGPIKIGMTPLEAEQASGVAFTNTGSWPENPYCYYVEPIDNTLDVSFMVTEGRISRVDVGAHSPIVTLSGAGVGSSEEAILALYPGQIDMLPHRYVMDGNYLEFIPRDEVDSDYRVIFESSDGYVTHYRAGRLPEINNIERCN
ncbi:MAG: hypothetical protein AAGH78_11735 [Cyanobacteria bacterium P01_H01_bin.58]